MAKYRFDGKMFLKTLFSFVATGVFMGALIGVFWEDKPAQEEALKRQDYKEKVLLEFIVRDALIGLGIGAALGVILGGVGSFSRQRDRGIWGE